MDLQAFRFLQTPVGERWLAELAGADLSPQTHLAWASRLRQEVEPAWAQALLETALLRRRAAAKFSRADHMFFTREALEQASAEVVARYRAGRYAAAGLTTVLDLCCGIGGDALALAAGGHVIGVDEDEVRLAMAAHNVAVYEGEGVFRGTCADVLALSPSLLAGRGQPRPRAIFFDPARRDERGERVYHLAQYRPPVTAVLTQWRRAVPHMGVKVSPGLDYGEMPAQTEVEFISVDGELREAVLWLGDLRQGADRRATLLPTGMYWSGPHWGYNPDFWASLSQEQRQVLIQATAQAMVRMVVQYQKLDESALAEAVAKGHQVHQPGPDMVASVEAFRVSATENIYETVQTRYGIEDAKALIDDFRATYAKWEKLLENVDRDDEAALAELAMQEIYNKLAPDYGIR